MRWITEPNERHPQWPELVLLAEGAPLPAAFTEYWRKVLTDGYSLPPGERADLAVEILAQSFDGDDPGSVRAIFYNSVNRQSEKTGVYVLRGGELTCMQADGEADPAYERRALVWLLEQYKTLKGALEEGSTWPLFVRLRNSLPLAVRAGTSNGWLDLRPGQEGFGPLPADDQRLLAGKEKLPDDPLQDLTAGVLDVAWTRLLEELSAALVEYTPPHFQTIRCKVTEGREQGQRALFYDIQCPEFPDEGTTQPNARVHTAATRLVQHVTEEQGAFPGVLLTVTVSPDGSWTHGLAFLEPSGS